MPPTSIDAYLATVAPDKRAALSELRTRLHALLLNATETISYGMPALAIDGRSVVWFAAWKSHLSIYPLTESFTAAHREALAGYRTTKGALHFDPAAPLPQPLLEAFVRARVADLASGDE
ncbi:MAG: iron chaperone [Chloroflexota bacterium]